MAFCQFQALGRHLEILVNDVQTVRSLVQRQRERAASAAVTATPNLAMLV